VITPHNSRIISNGIKINTPNPIFLYVVALEENQMDFPLTPLVESSFLNSKFN